MPTTTDCAGELQAWGYNPKVGRSAPCVPDPSHIVQIQFEMHALNVRTGYLGIWTPLHGLTVFQVSYCESFMQLASRVMKMVAEKYLLPEASLSRLPTGSIERETTAFREIWCQMMDELITVCREAKCLIVNGTHSQTACVFIQLVAQLHYTAFFCQYCMEPPSVVAPVLQHETL
jgi:hypothetical protein